MGASQKNGPQEWEERMKKKLLRSKAEKTRKTHIYNSEDRGEGKPALDANSRNCEDEGVALARLRDDVVSGEDRVYYTNWGNGKFDHDLSWSYMEAFGTVGCHDVDCGHHPRISIQTPKTASAVNL